MHTVSNHKIQMGNKNSGRRATTRGVSLSPREAALVDSFAALTGVGLTEQVRQTVLQRLPAAVAMLRDMQEAGMETAAPVMTERIVYAEGEDTRRALYEDSFEA